MYSDFFLWLFDGQVSDTGFILSQTFPILIALLILVFQLIKCKVYEHRNNIKFRSAILQKIVAPEEKESNLLTIFAENLSRLFFKETPDYTEMYKNQIENAGYAKALWKLRIFTKEQLLGSSKALSKISFKEHRLNKIKWKRYKKAFKKHLKTK